MRRAWIIGWLLAGLSFPGMLYLEGKRMLPKWPPPEVLYACDMSLRSFTHCAKDQFIELVRYDAQWWGKFLVMCLVLSLMINLGQWIIRR